MILIQMKKQIVTSDTVKQVKLLVFEKPQSTFLNVTKADSCIEFVWTGSTTIRTKDEFGPKTRFGPNTNSDPILKFGPNYFAN